MENIFNVSSPVSMLNSNSSLAEPTTKSVNATSIYDTYDFFVHPHWRQFGQIPDYWHYLVGIYITIVGIGGIIGNSVVIWIFSTTRHLKTPSNLLIINLALSDLIFSCVNGFPLLTISAFNKRWMWGNTACQLYGFIGGCFGLMSINTLAAISIDRYINIAYPLSSFIYMTKKKSFLMIVCVWIWSLVWAVPPIFGWGAYIAEGFLTSCTFDYLSRDSYMRSYVFGLYIGGFVIPLLIIIVCYVFILQAIRHHDKEMAKVAKKLDAEDIRTNQEKAKTEIKIAKIAMAIVFLYILSWGPYAIIALIGQFGPTDMVTPLVSELPVMLAKSCAMHNPIVYAFSHPKFREELHKRAPFLVFLHKDSKAKTKSHKQNKAKRLVSRVTSADTSEPPGTISEASSCVSDIDGSASPQPEGVNRRTTDNNPTGNYNDIVRELMRVLVGIATRQPFLQSSFYLTNNQNSNHPEEGIDTQNQALIGPNLDMTSYLPHTVSTNVMSEGTYSNTIRPQTTYGIDIRTDDDISGRFESSVL